MVQYVVALGEIDDYYGTESIDTLDIFNTPEEACLFAMGYMKDDITRVGLEFDEFDFPDELYFIEHLANYGMVEYMFRDGLTIHIEKFKVS